MPTNAELEALIWAQIDEYTRLKALMHTNLEIMDVDITTETFRQMTTRVLDVVGTPIGGPDY